MRAREGGIGKSERHKLPWATAKRPGDAASSACRLLPQTENCLVRLDMTIVVCDFGLARVMKGQIFREQRGAFRSARSINLYLGAREAHESMSFDAFFQMRKTGDTRCERPA